MPTTKSAAMGFAAIRHNGGPSIKLVDLFKLVGTGLSLVCSWSFGVQLVAVICSSI